MIINRNSWHYKLAILGDNEWSLPKTLCPYFWYVVFKLFLVSVVTFTLGAAAWLIGVPIITPILGLMGITLSAGAVAVPALFTGILTFALIFGSAFLFWMGVAWLKETIKEKLRQRRWAKAVADEEAGIVREPSVFVEFIKTRKSKMCPFVEYKTIDKVKK